MQGGRFSVVRGWTCSYFKIRTWEPFLIWCWKRWTAPQAIEVMIEFVYHRTTISYEVWLVCSNLSSQSLRFQCLLLLHLVHGGDHRRELTDVGRSPEKVVGWLIRHLFWDQNHQLREICEMGFWKMWALPEQLKKNYLVPSCWGLIWRGYTTQYNGSNKGTLQGTKHIPQTWHFEDDFPFPKVGYVNSLEGIFRDLILLDCRSFAFWFDSPARPTTHTEVEVEFSWTSKRKPHYGIF